MHSDLIGVLTDGANAPHVEAALRVLLQGCTEGPDLQLQRQCFLILHRLVEEWCGGGPAAVPGFGVFALQQALHCTLLHHTALYYAILYHTTLYYTILYRTLLYSALLYSTLLYYSITIPYSYYTTLFRSCPSASARSPRRTSTWATPRRCSCSTPSSRCRR